MSDGEALLLALVRRKGSPHALADWLLERVPEHITPRNTVALRFVYGTLYAHVKWEIRNGGGVWVGLLLKWGRKPRRNGILAFIDVDKPDAGCRLAQHLNETFIRRRK